MIKALAVNGSPRKEKGFTEMILSPFVRGMQEAGAETEVLYVSRLKLKPCTCGTMECWYGTPGECRIKDDMETVYPKLRRSQLLVLAIPVYAPLPGALQDFLNRLCPLMEPRLENRDGRTRARLRKDVHLRKTVLVSVGGWWEKENLETVEGIAREFAENASVEFGGSVLRPHAFVMEREGKLTEDGKSVLDAARRAGNELVKDGRMRRETLEMVSRPLVKEEELRRVFNQLLSGKM